LILHVEHQRLTHCIDANDSNGDKGF